MSSIVASSSVQSITHASLKVISFAPGADAAPLLRPRLEVKGQHPGKMRFTRARADGGAPVASEKFRTEVIFFSFRTGLAETGSPRTGREASLLPAWRPS